MLEILFPGEVWSRGSRRDSWLRNCRTDPIASAEQEHESGGIDSDVIS